MKTLVITIAFVLLGNMPMAFAALTVDQYLKYREIDREAATHYLVGITDGYLFANSYLECIEKKTPLYCQPKKLALNGAAFESMIDHYLSKLSKDEKKKEMAVVLPIFMLHMLQQVFPCGN